MILTSTANIDGKHIIEYKGIVFGEVITGISILKDFSAGLRNIFGGRSQGYEEELAIARKEALQEMEARAKQLGANAIIGVKMDYEALGTDNGMLMVTCSGTAVKVV
ncbi:MAG: putative heavy metal-binding protein [Aerococcaceae bacterium]|nr:putative heavy metal-binding protein [Aerococcaceae bacterium]